MVYIKGMNIKRLPCIHAERCQCRGRGLSVMSRCADQVYPDLSSSACWRRNSRAKQFKHTEYKDTHFTGGCQFLILRLTGIEQRHQQPCITTIKKVAICIKIFSGFGNGCTGLKIRNPDGQHRYAANIRNIRTPVQSSASDADKDDTQPGQPPSPVAPSYRNNQCV